MTPDRRLVAKLAAPTINLASIVHGLGPYLGARGSSAAEAVRRVGIDCADLTDPDRRVPLVRYLELLETCADLLSDRQFGLKFGAQYHPKHAGVVGNVALASRTLGEAFQMLGRYLPTMVDATVHGLDISDSTALAYSYYVDPLLMTYRQKVDWAIAFACNLVRVGLDDPDWTPLEVQLPQLADETAAERSVRSKIMGHNIQTGHSWAGIRFDAALLDRPMVTGDAMIARLMQHYGDLRLATLPDATRGTQQLRQEIARMLVKGDVTIERLALAVGTSVRTLQRRLRESGLSYNDLLNDVRKTLALNLLENERLAISEIAFSLGYSEVSAFNHAFRRWVGQSPGDYRRGCASARAAGDQSQSNPEVLVRT